MSGSKLNGRQSAIDAINEAMQICPTLRKEKVIDCKFYIDDIRNLVFTLLTHPIGHQVLRYGV